MDSKRIVMITTACADYQANNIREGLGLVLSNMDDYELTVVTDSPEDGVWGFLLDDPYIVILTTGAGVPECLILEDHADRLVIVDGADQAWNIRYDIPHALYLKREAHPGLEGAEPFPFCVRQDVWDRDVVPWEERGINVLFAAHLGSNPIRVQIYELLKRSQRRYSIVLAGDPPETRIQPDEYLDALRRTKIAVAPWGLGQDTNTHWEIPACGAVLLSQKRSIQIPNNFIDGMEAYTFRLAPSVVGVVRELLNDQEKAAEIARRGREKVLK